MRDAFVTVPPLEPNVAASFRFSDLLVVGPEEGFMERTVRISRLGVDEAAADRAAIRAAVPARTGRVT